MTVKLITRDNVGEYVLEGRFDSDAAPKIRATVEETCERFSKIIFNLDRLVYISSAGLRVLKIVNTYTKTRGIDFSLTNVTPFVMEILEMTGFAQILNFE